MTRNKINEHVPIEIDLTRHRKQYQTTLLITF